MIDKAEYYKEISIMQLESLLEAELREIELAIKDAAEDGCVCITWPKFKVLKTFTILTEKGYKVMSYCDKENFISWD